MTKFIVDMVNKLWHIIYKSGGGKMYLLNWKKIDWLFIMYN